jgi:hypothetical protein
MPNVRTGGGNENAPRFTAAMPILIIPSVKIVSAVGGSAEA